MRRASFEEMSCSIARSLEVIGEWWTLLILRDAFFGVTRFEELQERLGIARNILAKRLETLVEHGVLERRCYDRARGRHDYVLTDKGKALWPVLVAIRQWGDEWVVGAGNEAVRLIHTSCGKHTTAVLTCDHCGEELRRTDVRAVAGPGLDDEAMVPLRSTRDATTPKRSTVPSTTRCGEDAPPPSVTPTQEIVVEHTPREA